MVKKTSSSKRTPSSNPHHASGDQVTDPRFSALHSDLRFMPMKKNDLKVEIDQRFSHMLHDEEFTSQGNPISVSHYHRQSLLKKITL